MERINFKRDLIENFIEVSTSFERFLQETLTYIDNFFENIEKIDPEKWVITHEFIEYLISEHDGVGKETE